MKQKSMTGVAFVMIIAMVGVAGLTGDKEILFPEIAALVIGAWVAPKQPWQTNRIQMFVLMSLAAWVGVALSSMDGIPLLMRIMIGFVLAAITLSISRSTMFPMISACILPILIGTTGVVYPIAVMIMTLIIVAVQKLFEVVGWRVKKEYEPCECDIKIWLLRCVVLLLMAFLAVKLHYLFLVAPPLIVTFVEFSESDSAARKHPVKIGITICVAALAGSMCAYVTFVKGDAYLVMMAGLAVVIVGICFYITRVLFPPAGAIALLPFILQPKVLFIYPLLVSMGCVLFIVAGLLVGSILVDKKQ